MDEALSYDVNVWRWLLKIGYPYLLMLPQLVAVDVDFPIDVVLYKTDTYHIVEYRYNAKELMEISEWWQKIIREAIRELPHDWIEGVFSKLEDSPIPIKNVIQD